MTRRPGVQKHASAGSGNDRPFRVVFPEAADARVLEAARRILAAGFAEPLLVGPVPAGAGGGFARLRALRPEGARLRRAAAHLRERRRHRGMSDAEAIAAAGEPLLFADLMVGLGEADASVAGARATTGEVIRAALTAIGVRAGVSKVSGAFLMEFPDGRPPLVFADGAVIPEPDAADLAEIAILTAETARALLREEPRIALLSYSTWGSSRHVGARRPAEAVRLVRQLRPDLLVEGELQADAALVPEVAARKAPGSPVAGRANVLVFPDLASANIAYKVTERLAGASAAGPILQGLRAPAYDLSRGASASDIVRLARLAAGPLRRSAAPPRRSGAV